MENYILTWLRVAAESVCSPQTIDFSQAFASQAVGIKRVRDDTWLASFMDYD
jgi:hypothetical protein